MEIRIPYEGDQPLVLDPAAKKADLGTEVLWLFEAATEGELPRILTSAVCLFHAEAGTIAECLRTAVIWERG